MTKLNIPAKIYDATLSFINSLRRRENLKPLKRIMSGNDENTSCPIQNSVDNRFAIEYSIYIHYNDCLFRGTISKSVKKFITLIDESRISWGSIKLIRGMK